MDPETAVFWSSEMLDSYKQQNKELKQLDLVNSQLLVKHAFIHVFLDTAVCQTLC